MRGDFSNFLKEIVEILYVLPKIFKPPFCCIKDEIKLTCLRTVVKQLLPSFIFKFWFLPRDVDVHVFIPDLY